MRPFLQKQWMTCAAAIVVANVCAFKVRRCERSGWWVWVKWLYQRQLSCGRSWHPYQPQINRPQPHWPQTTLDTHRVTCKHQISHIVWLSTCQNRLCRNGLTGLMAVSVARSLPLFLASSSFTYGMVFAKLTLS